MAAMVTKQITVKVLNYSDITKELTEGHWISDYKSGILVQVHLDDDEDDKLSMWLKEKYPELIDEDSFYIEMDY